MKEKKCKLKNKNLREGDKIVEKARELFEVSKRILKKWGYKTDNITITIKEQGVYIFEKVKGFDMLIHFERWWV